MSQIVHITFEKLTGLKGEIEGDFICDPDKIDIRLPLIFKDYLPIWGGLLVFEQMHRIIHMKFAAQYSIQMEVDYIQHFTYGTNFLIKSWSYGGGVTINSQPPN